MKVVAVLEQDVAAGGGYHQGLNAIVQMAQLCRDRYPFAVLTTCRDNLEALHRLGVDAEFHRPHRRDRWLAQHADTPFWRGLRRRLRRLGPLERKLVAMRCDLAYFVTPSPLPAALQTLNFVATVWDLCHRENPEFPEVREFGELQAREARLRTVLPAAFRVVADSQALQDLLVRYYGIDHQRIVAMPFAPSPALADPARDDAAVTLDRHALEPGYFFYPAQLWAHKNHVRIIEALARLRTDGIVAQLVCAGGDRGLRRHLENTAAALGVAPQVRFLGFVPDAALAGLYAGCRAVVMPTYFGPTNLPPLEAWASGRPLIYSRQLAGQAGDAARLVDPDSAGELAEAMRELLDDALAAELAARGRARLAALAGERDVAAAELAAALEQFARRRSCWAPPA